MLGSKVVASASTVIDEANHSEVCSKETIRAGEVGSSADLFMGVAHRGRNE